MSFFGLELDPWVLFSLIVFAVFLVIISYPWYIRIREWHRAKSRNFTVKVGTISANQLMDKFKPRDSEPIEIELEVIHLKRATGNLAVQHDSKESKFDWILEFRGNTLILSLKEGDLKANWVVEALEDDYRRRYRVEDVLYPISTREDGKVADSTVDDPQKFFEYLHLLHTLPGVQINRVGSRRGKNIRKFFRE